MEAVAFKKSIKEVSHQKTLEKRNNQIEIKVSKFIRNKEPRDLLTI